MENGQKCLILDKKAFLDFCLKVQSWGTPVSLPTPSRHHLKPHPWPVYLEHKTTQYCMDVFVWEVAERSAAVWRRGWSNRLPFTIPSTFRDYAPDSLLLAPTLRSPRQDCSLERVLLGSSSHSASLGDERISICMCGKPGKKLQDKGVNTIILNSVSYKFIFSVYI